MSPTLVDEPAPDHEAAVRHHHCPFLALLAGAGLILGACSTTTPDTDLTPSAETTTPTSDDTPPTDTPSPTEASPTPTDEATTSADDDGTAAGVPDLSTRCTITSGETDVEQVEFAVPEGWRVDGSCEFLDPTQQELEPATQPDTAVGVRVEPVDFATIAAGDELDRARRWLGARSGYQAVRLAGEATGEGLRPAGEPTVRWLVDLDAGTDEEGETLVLSAHPTEGASIDLAAEAVDRIAQTVRVVPAADQDSVAVTRVEGGGQPWTVTHDADDRCVRLHAGAPDGDVLDEACELGTPGEGPVGAVLEDDDLRVVAGLASPLAVRVETSADATVAGSVTTAVEGASLFAHPAPQVPAEVSSVDAVGDELGSATIE